MRILSARIFSKTFGGKIRHIWTDVTYRINNDKSTHSYLKRPYFFFFKFFGGKIFYFKHPLRLMNRPKKVTTLQSSTLGL